ncbi:MULTISPECIES: DNA circularization N-terminal domain-containing protein [Bradyrhizobium]|uniref:DNA circularization N-terminal domain-containing protein n=2 Tax=Bradyrhizobium TaxID=374 RepID=UPI0020A17A5C|nr:DNA circularization N-terminal domain-containing protein [Bradyrhizobium japonicum]MCP1778831.1 prophage DNA circulation protein [Bradyrhizobium japonicum]MCP1958171.1 prophage DNA circulation protein [Bradyrhizobium japonicum]
MFDLPTAWRDRLMPASFRNARFHCEVNSQESGRRIVLHEYPKKDYPYAEDMGRVARAFSVRGYCIVYPYDDDANDILYRRDYQLARNRLILALEEEGPGTLRLPTLGDKIVVCPRYRVSEEEKVGGFCVFDMQFQEQGLDPQRWVPAIDTAGALLKESQNTRNEAKRMLANPPPGVNV